MEGASQVAGVSQAGRGFADIQLWFYLPGIKLCTFADCFLLSLNPYLILPESICANGSVYLAFSPKCLIFFLLNMVLKGREVLEKMRCKI